MNTRTVQQKKIHKQTLYSGAAFVFLVSLFVLYIYFVSASVLHVVMRQEVERKTSNLHSEIAALETEYIQAQHAVSEDIAKQQGYVAVESKIFIDRTGETVAFTRVRE